jgi:hypothetical protein
MPLPASWRPPQASVLLALPALKSSQHSHPHLLALSTRDSTPPSLVHPAGWLAASAGFLLDAPFPRIFTQQDLTQAAVAAHATVPEEHAHLLVRELHSQLRLTAPDTVARAIEAQLVKPLELWTKAHKVAKVCPCVWLGGGGWRGVLHVRCVSTRSPDVSAACAAVSMLWHACMCCACNGMHACAVHAMACTACAVHAMACMHVLCMQWHACMCCACNGMHACAVHACNGMHACAVHAC